MSNFDYESSYRKVMDESVNNIRKMDKMALLQQANKMKEEVNNRIRGSKKK